MTHNLPLLGQGEFRYSPVSAWQRAPADYQGTEVSAAAVDSRDQVYVFNRGEHPVMVYDRQGTLLRTWGADVIVHAHGITIGPDDAVYCTDDFDHTVQKFTPEGKLLLTLGTSGRPSETGATSIDYRTILHAGPPFYFPTNVALAANGDIYVTDGYGNARVHHFSATGELRNSWGQPGAGPGEFRVPHGIAITADGRIIVADRENCRLQFFSLAGEFLTEWKDIARPCQVALDAAGNVYVAELGFRAGMWPGTVPPSPTATGGRISIFTPHGELLSRFGGGEHPTAPGDFFAPHDIRVDSQGDIYLAEVVMSAGGKKGLIPPECHTLQKFERA